MNPAQSAGKSTKSLAQNVAKQIAREPLEVLKTAREQAFGPESSKDHGNQGQPRPSEGQTNQGEEQKKALDNLKSVRRVEALNRELEDIRKHDVFKELQAKISQGETIPLEDYPELSPEQKQVLMAQMEAYKIQNSKFKIQNEGVLVEPAAKKGRQLFNFGKKTAMKREQTHVEKPVPPSG